VQSTAFQTGFASEHPQPAKTELFAAVFEQVEAQVAARMGEAIAASNQTETE
jgi:hypothetical protein